MDWQQRVDKLWDSMDSLGEEEFLTAMAALVAERPDDDPAALFEQGCAFDSSGHSDRAMPCYRRALAAGLSGYNRRRATIQLASSLRNLGSAQDSVALLSAELAAPVEGEAAALDDAVRAFLALALVDVGREREAVSLALGSLAPHLPRYQRSLGAYARALTG
jgi:tetratricopeptide (TPR) repeat protein